MQTLVWKYKVNKYLHIKTYFNPKISMKPKGQNVIDEFYQWKRFQAKMGVWNENYIIWSILKNMPKWYLGKLYILKSTWETNPIKSSSNNQQMICLKANVRPLRRI